ncbi:MAG: tetratricopeptide repeat protein [Deltaproteobacteria bacterium]|nr:tetratricopeptide repeat protein [Deltaproteobacteria bacterium]
MTNLKFDNQHHVIFFLYAIIIIIALSGCSHTDRRHDLVNGLEPEINEVRAINSLDTDAPEKNHIALAKTLIEKRYYDVALRQLQTASHDRENRSAELFYLMGVCYRESERYAQAIDSFNRAIQTDKEFAFAYNGLGLTLAFTGQGDKALEHFIKAIELNPARADFYNNAGFLAMKQGQYKQAEDFFRKAISIETGFEQAINNLAICLGMTGREEEALGLLMTINSPATAYHDMGVIYNMQGNNEKAKEMFDKANAIKLKLPVSNSQGSSFNEGIK